MRTDLCERFGIEYPIFAFTPSEHVAAAVSRAGGLGVLGAVRFNDAEELDETLTWLDDNTDGKPYGVDVVMPMKIPTEGKSVDLKAMIPEAHITFVQKTLQQLGVPPLPDGEGGEGVLGWLHSTARSHVDVALKHRPVLIANALGSPPVDVIEKAHEHGVQVAALAGAAKHALSHVKNGVDIIIAQGYEAGGHTGEIASMVLTPEVVDAVGPDVPVLGAGGIGSGRQVAASLALGAQGVWTGSVWLTTEEYSNLNTNKGMTEAFLRASSSDTVRTRVYTGKPARLLKTKWTEAWAEDDAPEPLPMPLQNLLVADAHSRMNQHGDPDVISMPVGQIVGRMNEVRSVADVMAGLVSEYEEAVSPAGEDPRLRPAPGNGSGISAVQQHAREQVGEGHPRHHDREAGPRRQGVRHPQARGEAGAGSCREPGPDVRGPCAVEQQEQHRQDEDHGEESDQGTRCAADDPADGAAEEADEREVHARADHDPQHARVGQRVGRTVAGQERLRDEEADDRRRDHRRPHDHGEDDELGHQHRQPSWYGGQRGPDHAGGVLTAHHEDAQRTDQQLSEVVALQGAGGNQVLRVEPGGMAGVVADDRAEDHHGQHRREQDQERGAQGAELEPLRGDDSGQGDVTVDPAFWQRHPSGAVGNGARGVAHAAPSSLTRSPSCAGRP